MVLSPTWPRLRAQEPFEGELWPTAHVWCRLQPRHLVHMNPRSPSDTGKHRTGPSQPRELSPLPAWVVSGEHRVCECVRTPGKALTAERLGC